MATIKIHNWKVADEDDTNALVFVPPEYHQPIGKFLSGGTRVTALSTPVVCVLI